MTNRLIRHEATLFLRSFTDAFARARDWVLLLLVLVIAGSWLREQGPEILRQSLPDGAAWLALLALPASLAWRRIVSGRLTWLAENSVIAGDALQPRSRGAYWVFAHLLLAIPLLGVALLLGIATSRLALTFALAILAITSAALVAPRLHLFLKPKEKTARHAVPMSSAQGPKAVLHAVVARQTSIVSNPTGGVVLIFAAVFALTHVAAWSTSGLPDVPRVTTTLLPLLAALLLAARIDADLLAFLPFAGYSPAFIGLAVSTLPLLSGMAAGAALGSSPVPPGSILVISAILMVTCFVVLGVARSWLYLGHDKRIADFKLQIEYAGLVLIALLLPPLALVALIWRLWRLHRHASSLRWVQP